MPGIRVKKITTYLKKLHFKEVLAVLFILVGIYFFRQQRQELRSIIPALGKSNWHWIAAGVSLTVVYIFLQAAMYVFSFASVKAKLPWLLALELFLKRNFLSVFLPAGGITALAYMPASLRHADIHKKEVHQSSGIYAFTGFLSLFLVGLPVIIYTFTQAQHINNSAIGIISLAPGNENRIVSGADCALTLLPGMNNIATSAINIFSIGFRFKQ